MVGMCKRHWVDNWWNNKKKEKEKLDPKLRPL